MNTVHIATYADEKYLQHACVLARSLENCTTPNVNYHFFIVYSGCDVELIGKARLSFESMPENVSVEFLAADFRLPSVLRAKRSYVNSSIYNKILMYEMIPKQVGRILFVDSDAVFRRDPAELFAVDLEGKLLAAVREKHYLTNHAPDLRNALGLSDYRQYFNSGVMVIDLDCAKAMNLFSNAIKFAADNWDKTPNHDQDAFNAVVAGNWVPLSPLWNPRWKNEIVLSNGESTVMSQEDVFSNDLEYLVHFSGPSKPWLYMCEHPRKTLYLKVLKRTAFRDYRYPDKSALNIMRKAYLRFRRALGRIKRRVIHACWKSVIH